MPGAADGDRRPAGRRRDRRPPSASRGAARVARGGAARAWRGVRRAAGSGEPARGARLSRPRHRAQSAFARRRVACRRRPHARHRPRDARRMRQRVLRGASSRAPRGARPRDGILHLQQRRGRHPACAGSARADARRRGRFRRPPWQRHRGNLRRRRARADGVDVPVSALPVLGRRAARRQHAQRAAGAGQRRRELAQGGGAGVAAGAGGVRAAGDLRLRRLRRASRGSAGRTQFQRRRLRLGDAGAARARPTPMPTAVSCRRSRAATRCRHSAAARRCTSARCSPSCPPDAEAAERAARDARAVVARPSGVSASATGRRRPSACAVPQASRPPSPRRPGRRRPRRRARRACHESRAPTATRSSRSRAPG